VICGNGPLSTIVHGEPQLNEIKSPGDASAARIALRRSPVTPGPCPFVPALESVSSVTTRDPVATQNGCALVVPIAVLTVTLRGPNAEPAASTNFAVIVVALVTATLLAVTPDPLTFTLVAPAMKFVPVSVSVTVFPVTPVVALNDVSVGRAPKINVALFEAKPVALAVIVGPVASAAV